MGNAMPPHLGKVGGGEVAEVGEARPRTTHPHHLYRWGVRWWWGVRTRLSILRNTRTRAFWSRNLTKPDIRNDPAARRSTSVHRAFLPRAPLGMVVRASFAGLFGIAEPRRPR